MTTAVQTFVSSQNAQGRGSNGIALDYDATGGITMAGENAVIGFQNDTFTSGYDAVVLSGARTGYSIDIAPNGVETITDTTTGGTTSGQTITVSGADYLLFGGAATITTEANGAIVYPGMDFVLNPAQAQIAEIYQAGLGRQPDLPGIEYWISAYQSGALDMNGVAYQFIVSEEFQNLNPEAAAILAPGGAVSPTIATAFVTQLYTNVLHRAPDTAGLAYWVGILNSLTATPSQVLADFAISPENTANLTAQPGGTGWLIIPAAGGYADAGTANLTPSSVLTTGEANSLINTALVSHTPATATVGNLTLSTFGTSQEFGVIAAQGDLIVNTPFSSTAAILLSSTVNAAQVQAGTALAENALIDAPASGNAYIEDPGANVYLSGTNNEVTPSTGGADQTTLVSGAIGLLVYSFGAGDFVNFNGWGVTQIVTPSSIAPINGVAYTETYNTSGGMVAGYAINVGNVGDGSVDAVARAADLVISHTAIGSAIPTEHYILFGQTSSGDTVVYAFDDSAFVAAAPHTPPTSFTQVESSFEQGVRLVGLTAANLTAAEFSTT